MRYWIYWNELIQGAFELDELVSLHAFSENLPVCMEDRQEWMPASRVADLASAVDLWRTRQTPPPPPPPPPKTPPVVEPLQGEFFVEAAGQQTLFERLAGGATDELPKGPYAFAPVTEPPHIFEIGDPGLAFTSPIRFKNGHSDAPVLLTPGVQPVVPPPATEAPVVEWHYTQTPSTAPAEPPTIAKAATPPPVETPAVEAPPSIDVRQPEEESVVPTLEAPEAVPPAVVEPEHPALDETPQPSVLSRFLRWIKRDKVAGPVPETVEAPLVSDAVEAPPAPVEPEASPRPSANDALLETPPAEALSAWSAEADANAAGIEPVTTEPPPAEPEPVLDLDEPPSRRSTLVPWIAGICCVLTLGVGIVYWIMDRMSSRSAIDEAIRRPMARSVAPAPAAPAPVVVPPPPPAPAPAEAAPVRAPAKPKTPKPAVSSKPKALPVLPTPAVKPAQKPAAKPAPTAKPVRAAAPKPELPGLASSPAPAMEMPKPVASKPPSTPAAPSPADPWVGRQTDAINAVMGYKIMGGKRTIGDQAKTMLSQMHEKELLHAAESGERLYLPDKLAWLSLREEGSRYRVYLNFSALQGNGERAQTRSYQFAVDLQSSVVTSDDNATQQDFMRATSVPSFSHSPMADEIDSLLGGIDLLNKHKLRKIMIEKGRHTKADLKQAATHVSAAQARVHRAIVYFRMRYPEKALQNVARAYAFSNVLREDGK